MMSSRATLFVIQPPIIIAIAFAASTFIYICLRKESEREEGGEEKKREEREESDCGFFVRLPSKKMPLEILPSEERPDFLLCLLNFEKQITKNRRSGQTPMTTYHSS